MKYSTGYPRVCFDIYLKYEIFILFKIILFRIDSYKNLETQYAGSPSGLQAPRCQDENPNSYSKY